MKILLCYPPVTERYNTIRDSGLAPHLSILCIASHLKKFRQDLTFCLVDGHHEDLAQIKQRIRDFEPDIVGYSVDFTNYDNAVCLSRYVKEILPESWNVCGSNHATNLCDAILQNQKSIDFVSLYDGEPSWEDLVCIRSGEMDRSNGRNLAYREEKNGDIVIVRTRTSRMELTYMADVDYGMIDLEPYFARQKQVLGEDFRMLQFTSQRGCANKPLCVFCGRYTDGIRFRDPSDYAREVAYWTEKLELTEVWDRSDSFIQHVGWLKEFCRVLGQYTDRFASGKTTFKTYARADQLLRSDVIEMLRQLNFRMVFIGYEAGDDRILQNIGKHATLDVYRRASRLVLEHGLDIDASFIVGLPGENRESLANHLAFVRELIGMGLDKIRVNRLLVLPGTPLYEAVMQKNPDLRNKDSIHQDQLQHLLFQTDLYDLQEFDNDPAVFEQELRKTASLMTGAVLERGGGVEGYGYGKGKNILAGAQLGRHTGS
ncbi:MAG: B12-binding domain-containing radical SAM protein [Lachnospiraceae bacterium]|nr:B12-binding domain-containing radical SAM protein [Lachnospiraceae bacterium]